MLAPIFKVLDGPSATSVGTANASTGGLRPVISALSAAADLYPHDDEGLLQILHFRNQIAKNALRRSRWFGGRLFNKFSGEDADYIPISGTHLRQALNAAGIEPPSSIAARGKYLLRLDTSEDAVAALNQRRDQSEPKA